MASYPFTKTSILLPCFILLIGHIYGQQNPDISAIAGVVRSTIVSMDLSRDGQLVYISDASGGSYCFDIVKRGFFPATQMKDTPSRQSMKDRAAENNQKNKFKVSKYPDKISFAKRDGTEPWSLHYSQYDYNCGYSNTGKYFFLIPRDPFDNKNIGLKLIDLENGKMVLDSFSSAAGKMERDRFLAPFRPGRVSFDLSDHLMVVSGSKWFYVMATETGRILVKKNDGCNLAMLTPDGKVIISAHENMLSFYSAATGQFLFSSVEKNNTRGYQNPLPVITYQKVLENAPNSAQPPAGNKKLNKTMDSILESVTKQANQRLVAAGMVTAPEVSKLENEYFRIDQAKFNNSGTHMIIGYSAFADGNINQGQMEHSLNPVYYNILDMNTGKLLFDSAWKDARIVHAAFSPVGDLILIDYCKNSSLFHPLTASSMLEVRGTDGQKTLFKIGKSALLQDAEHDAFFSGDGKYLIVTNNWRTSMSLKMEIYNISARTMESSWTVPAYQEGEDIQLLISPAVKTCSFYSPKRGKLMMYSLTPGVPIIRSDMATDATGVPKIMDRSGSYYLRGGNTGFSVFDRKDSLLNSISYPGNVPDLNYLDFQVYGGDLYCVVSSTFHRVWSFIGVQQFADPKKARINVIKGPPKEGAFTGPPVGKFEMLTGCNGARNFFTEAAKGDLNFYSTKDGKALFHLRMIAEHEFIIWNRDGEYMSSSRDLTKRFKGIEEFEEEKNRPDIILRLIGSNDEGLISKYKEALRQRSGRSDMGNPAADKPASLAAKPASVAEKPTILLKSMSGSLGVTQKKYLVNIKAFGPGKLTKINAWDNNNPLWGKEGLDISQWNRSRLDTTIAIDLSEGYNIIEFAAQNSLGTGSRAEYIKVTYNPPVKTSPRVYFIGVGNERIGDDDPDNSFYAEKNVNDLADLFSRKYPGLRLKTFLNEKATVDNILSARKDLLNTTENDIVIFYLSGHGIVDTVARTWRFLTYRNSRETGIFKGLSFDEIESVLDKIPARKKLLVIDACYSGEIPGRSVGFDIFDLMINSFSDLKKGTGTHIIASSKGNRMSLIDAQIQHGMLTYSLIKTLEAKGYSPGAEPLSVVELRDRVIKETTLYSKGEQVPVSRHENIEFNWNLW